LIEIVSKQIFPSKLTATGKMIDFLITFKSLDELFRNISIYPNEVDIIVLILFIIKSIVEIVVSQTVNYRVLSLEKNFYVR
jgi:hypothetical protein